MHLFLAAVELRLRIDDQLCLTLISSSTLFLSVCALFSVHSNNLAVPRVRSTKDMNVNLQVTEN